MNRLNLPIRPFVAVAANGNGHSKAIANPPEQKAISITGLPFWVNGWPSTSYEPGDVQGRTAYIGAALCYICVSYRALKIAEAPLMVVKESDAGERELPNHEINALLARPNPDFGMRRMLEATEIALCTTGSALWVKNRDRSGSVGSMYVFSGDDFTVKPANGRLYGQFLVQALGVKRTLGPADVVYFAYHNPTDPQKGLAPLEAALSQLNLGLQLTNRVKATVKNASVTTGLFVLDKDVKFKDDAAFEEYSQKFNSAATGLKSGNIMLATGGGTLHKTAMSLQELAMGELWQEVEAIVCACFKVPAALVGTVIGLKNSPWSHLDTVYRWFYDTTAIPEWGMIEEALTEQLLREVDPAPKNLVRFYTGRIRALQMDMLRRAQEASTALWWTVDEARIHTGRMPFGDERGEQLVSELNKKPAQLPNDDEPARGPRRDDPTGTDDDKT